MSKIYHAGVSENSTEYFYTPSAQNRELFYHPLCIGHYDCNENYKMQRSSYDSFLLLYTKSGQGIVSYRGREFPVRQGEAAIINCYEFHSYWSVGEWEIYWLHFDGAQSMKFYGHLIQSGNPVVSLSNALEYENVWKSIYSIFQKKKPIQEAMVSKYINDLLTLMVLSQTHGGRREIAKASIDASFAYINRHLDQPLRLEELADMASLSPYYFTRRFREETGYTPYEYILKARINLAKFYLKGTQNSVKNIAMSCGFQSVHSFCTTFKKNTGMTPSEYRSS